MAGRIPRVFINDLLARTDIVDLIELARTDIVDLTNISSI
ncbi:hypothetical protein LTSEWAN_4874 [Salmonella enterica subsp. enterica serovar Wandsworth str. A4-580]|uniref:Uncharacterized protein n=1 Tax=Salmonella enterica subsp. enterica serovar Wandsworth str. A4-580 TaxID=913086 RepID=G5SH21_SALET|nr:hypothetical protein LTSEWAN_4874 [Salmonella enterica subsp. enterica serovar Wandsworth str. A4-580]